MKRSLVLAVAIMAGLMLEWSLVSLESRGGTSAQFSVDDPAAKTVTVDQLCSGKLKLIDLSWPLNDKGAFWPGDDYKPFELRTIATLEQDGVLSKAFCMPEHQGTHLDAPNHFERNQISVDQIPLANLFAPGVMIDVSGQVSGNDDFRLGVADIEAWEKEHGQIPPYAVVLLNTGWGRHYFTPDRYRNGDVMGHMHFPGYSREAAEFLVNQRHVRGIGIDTLSIDYGLSSDFAVHHVVNRAGRYGLENLAQLQRLPARNFYLVVAPLKIETGSGGPTRVIAILP